MEINEEPYFMTNPEWYYFDEKEGRLKLTDKAPKKARKSYKDFYKLLESTTIKE
jgi:hypothetical protein